MEAIITPPVNGSLVISYETSEETIAKVRGELAELNCDTPAGYEAVRRGIAVTRTMRVAIENRRKQLKADSLDFGRRVDAEAKRLTGLVLEIEEPLQAKKYAVDEEKKRIAREAEEAERQRLEAEEKANRDAEEARLKAIRDAEEKRLAEERARLAAERKKLEAERAEQEARAAEENARRQAEQAKEAERLKAQEEAQRIERAKLADQQRALEAERQRIERIDFERRAKEQAEKEAAEKVERERQEAECRRKEEEVANASREAMRPDIDKIKSFGLVLGRVELPAAKTKQAKSFIAKLATDLTELAKRCADFGK